MVRYMQSGKTHQYLLIIYLFQFGTLLIFAFRILALIRISRLKCSETTLVDLSIHLLKTVARWVDANDAAAILLGDSVTDVTQSLPLQAAKDLGINPSTLEIYAAFNSDAREVADFYS